jgi:hypothetical protein
MNRQLLSDPAKCRAFVERFHGPVGSCTRSRAPWSSLASEAVLRHRFGALRGRWLDRAVVGPEEGLSADRGASGGAWLLAGLALRPGAPERRGPGLARALHQRRGGAFRNGQPAKAADLLRRASKRPQAGRDVPPTGPTSSRATFLPRPKPLSLGANEEARKLSRPRRTGASSRGRARGAGGAVSAAIEQAPPRPTPSPFQRRLRPRHRLQRRRRTLRPATGGARPTPSTPARPPSARQGHRGRTAAREVAASAPREHGRGPCATSSRTTGRAGFHRRRAGRALRIETGRLRLTPCRRPAPGPFPRKAIG